MNRLQTTLNVPITKPFCLIVIDIPVPSRDYHVFNIQTEIMCAKVSFLTKQSPWRVVVNLTFGCVAAQII